MTVLTCAFSPPPPPCSNSAQLIDVVWSCSPGPGLSRAGRGTGVPSECVRSSRSARGAPRLAFPSCPLGRVRKAGVGVWPPALTFGLPSPALGCLVGPWVFGHSRCALLRLPGVCPASGPPRGGEGCAAATLRAPAWVCERASSDPRWCPWSAPGRPSGARGRAVVFPLNPVSSLGPRHGGVRVSRWGGGVETVREALFVCAPLVGGGCGARALPRP